MCGIFGYIGNQKAAEILLDGLQRLEYRGYDSSGIGVVTHDHQAVTLKAPGKIQNLSSLITSSSPQATVGIGHTRWATHGKPNEKNSHPHTDCLNKVLIVHNGIVENYADLKETLLKQGHKFSSDTDSEVIAHLIESSIADGCSFESAFVNAVKQLKGAQAVTALQSTTPSYIMTTRIGNAGGICIGHGNKEMFIASDITALVPLSNTITFLAPGHTAKVSQSNIVVHNAEGRLIRTKPQKVVHNVTNVGKGQFRHFMEKEIAEQPETILAAIGGRVDFRSHKIDLPEISLTKKQLATFNRIILVGMGTSLHAGMAGVHMIEALSGIPAVAENSSEFRYRNPVVSKDTLVISIGQSGETVDTLAAMEQAKRKQAKILTICNTDNSQAIRLADGWIPMRAGLEIGVAATKTFLNTLVSLYLFASYLGNQTNYLADSFLNNSTESLVKLPDQIGQIVQEKKVYLDIATKTYEQPNLMYIGRCIQYPVALEGALKMKEISYTHAEGMSAGELKHGPIALIDNSLPGIALAPKDHFYDKMLNTMSEIKTRGGTIIAVATDGDTQISKIADYTIFVPACPYLLSPVVTSVPLQLLAYHSALARGCDIDQPRNLAKSVTVE